ncbi:hypothetical protein DUF2762 [Gottschalkia acidurici 9a]|uniref:Bacteriocin UviB n=1 Tax=Gottschalkia acidurici (strain ATCC 7906 / DSM 604 / BCRC 14475 / CIP 104303 / KCTC 5404 / NCIMB 10678 / 9a) TaxID=1128398 RepID=K0B259_GOTA9|nr:BhlA/UviB family holin-like peptide [Gottschalkia acidurici]AFS79202.1 hypothetical protein DUF2762 [Gottschalkia acidurici 9a]
MEKEIIKLALSQGLWASLFVVMLFYVLNTNGKREGKYQNIIDNLTKKFNIVEEVQKDVKEIKNKIFK